MTFLTDLIGAVCVFALPFLLLFVAHGAGY
jgi:hypothetical protein